MVLAFNHTALQAQRQRQQIFDSLESVISSGVFLDGVQNQILTQRLQKYFSSKYVIPVASGDSALRLALSCLHLQKNDEVIIPDNAYPTACAAYQNGCRVVLADVDSNAQLSLSNIQKKITSHTKAVIVVHLYGLAGNIAEIANWLKKRHIILIEDCAQAFGTRVDKRAVGTFGQFACLSFYPTKNLGTLGDGGAIITQKRQDYDYLLQAKAYGEKKRYCSQFISGHSRLPEIQAAVLNTYLKTFRQQQAQRKQLAEYFYKSLAKSYVAALVKPLLPAHNVLPTLHLFVVRALWRNQLQTFLEKQGIETHIHYPLPVHRVPAFQTFITSTDQFPVAQKMSEETISLPFHQYLSHGDIDLIIKKIEQFYAQQLPKLKSIAFVFPAYNDQSSIAQLVKTVDHLAPLFAHMYQIIVVNDGSEDRTKQVLMRLQRKCSHLQAIHHSQNQGYGGALQTGFNAAQTEWVFYTDGDGQYDPSQIMLLLQQLRLHPHTDVINGYKQQRNDSKRRLILGWLYNSLLHLIYSIPIRDIDCDFRLIRTKSLQKISLQAKSGLFCLELITKLNNIGASFLEVGVQHSARQYGHSQFFRTKHLWNTFIEHLRYATK